MAGLVGMGRGSEALRAKWADPEFRAMMLEARKGSRDKISQSIKSLWEDPEYRDRVSAAQRRAEADHYTTKQGYVMLRYQNHPLASQFGEVLEHRKVLYDSIGPGEHCCHWCQKTLAWNEIHVDHLDDDKQNNDPSNLAPSCFKCNIDRGRA